jgi:thiol-disulfide isomerase/thioredoxin
LTKIKSGGSGFISQHDPRLLFGLGKDPRAQSIEVTWPNGKVESFAGEMKANTSLLLSEGAGKTQVVNLKSAKLPDPLTRDEMLAEGLKIGVGRTLPDLKLSTVAGKASSLRDQLKPGRRVLINIWATWCTPCAREMPELESLRAKLAEHRVDLIGLNVDTEPDAPIKSFVNEKGVKYPIFIGGIPVVEQLYATDDLRVPISIVVNDKGIVTEIIAGWSAETERKFRALAGQVTKSSFAK